MQSIKDGKKKADLLEFDYPKDTEGNLIVNV